MSVELTFVNLQEVSTILAKSNEVSLVNYIEESARKNVLLSAASQFEHDLCKCVRDFTAKAAAENELIVSIIEHRAISRQYHTWFDWKNKSAGPFFSMFGPRFSERMKTIKREEAEFSDATEAFLEIGQARNLLVHGNYSVYPLEKTSQEIFSMYVVGCGFVGRVKTELEGFERV